MYAIYADGVCIYNDVFALDSMKALNPKLTMEDSSAGSLSLTLPPTNVGYQTVSRLISTVSVRKDGEEIWAGRVISEEMDFWNNRVLYCEGELAFLNDSIQPPAEYPYYTIRGYIEKLLEVHNSKVPLDRQFTIGAVTVYDNSYPTFLTNYENTMKLLNDLVEKYGGHLRVRKVSGIMYLDYLEEYPDTSTQVIQFGSNLVDFTRNWDCTDFATVIVPLGKRLNNSPIKDLDAYLTVESVNGGSMYVKSDAPFAAFGWIEKVVTWDDVSDASVLLRKAQEYLADIQFDNMELELTALDLHYLNADVEAVKLLDEIRVISRPHGLDRMFPVRKLEIPLDSPEQTVFTLGDTVKPSLTSVNDRTSAAVQRQIDDLPKAHALLQEAKDNAAQLMNEAVTGYITITHDEYGTDTLYFSNLRDWTKADKLWKWNMNGLGYSKDGGKTYEVAITMDGAIVANFITAGTLNGDVIRAGVIQDPNGNVVLDLDTGTLTMKKGSIDIGNGNFTVDEEGNLYARSGTFAGSLDGAKGTFGGTVQAEDFLDSSGRSMMNIFKNKFTARYLDLYGLTITNSLTGETSFSVSETGVVTINGNITMGAGTTINWATVTEVNTDKNSAYSLADSAYKLADANRNPSYITATEITETRISSPTIEGGSIYGGEFKWGTDWLGIEYNGILHQTNGNDGHQQTTVVELLSYKGLVLSSSEGFRIEAGQGLWINLTTDNVHVKRSEAASSQYMTLTEAIQMYSA